MATVLLVRHGRTTANSSGVLAGRTPGVRLDDTGGSSRPRPRGERLAAGPARRGVVTSPLERCRQTAKAIAQRQQPGPADGSPWRGEGAPRGRLRRVDRPRAQDARQGAAVEGRAGPPVRRRSSPGASRWRRCRHVRSPPSAAGTPRSRRSTDPTRSGPRSATATSSRRSWPTRWACTSTPSSGSSSTRPPSSVVRYTGGRPFVLMMNTHARRPRPSSARGRRGAARSRRRPDAAVGGGAGPAGPRRALAR